MIRLGNVLYVIQKASPLDIFKGKVFKMQYNLNDFVVDDNFPLKRFYVNFCKGIVLDLDTEESYTFAEFKAMRE